MVPTGAMGATLPLLTRYAVRNESEVGGRVGLLYTINTLGAVVGILTAAFVFLPMWGMYATMLAGVLVNFIVFLLAVFAVRIMPRTESAEGDGAAEESLHPGSQASLAGQTIPVNSATEDAIRPLLGRLVLRPCFPVFCLDFYLVVGLPRDGRERVVRQLTGSRFVNSALL